MCVSETKLLILNGTSLTSENVVYDFMLSTHKILKQNFSLEMFLFYFSVAFL